MRQGLHHQNCLQELRTEGNRELATASAKWCKHCIGWRFIQSWMPRATLKLTPQLKPSKNYTSRSNHYMQLHAESNQSSFVYHSSRNLSSLLGKLNCGKCWLSSWFNKFNSGNKLCKSATCCNSSLVFFPFLKRAGQDLAQTNTVMNVKNTKKSWKYFKYFCLFDIHHSVCLCLILTCPF